MSISRFSRNALSSCVAAAILYGCGGSQAPIGAPLSVSTVGLAAQRVHRAITYRVLFIFGHHRADGAYPNGGLIYVNGRLYGTTNETAYDYPGGGGTVYSLTLSGKEKVLANYLGGDKGGAGPGAGLIDVKGTLYGTLRGGGSGSSGGSSSGNCYNRYVHCGRIFAITTSGKFRVIHNLPDPDDGGLPVAVLTGFKDTLYGTTTVGGDGCHRQTNRCGTVFTITTSGAERLIHSFNGPPHDGSHPNAGLIDVNGTLYGTTEDGGAKDGGTVFSITPSGKETVLHSFGGPGDGRLPQGGPAGLLNVNGTFYGTTGQGGAENDGTVYSITQSGAETVIHSFAGYPYDGANPRAGLINIKGTLYGATRTAGVKYHAHEGTVFSMTLSGKETILHNFGGRRDANSPNGGLLNINGTLYGTTAGGYGNNVRFGSAFQLTP